ncbi:MAG: LysM peptidoglycan-binding domain-containing protein [Lachnospiraceae bacterium]|nr:LysM peptidoglycan-binding domain-containing protein [Lachnospiraceae bacterium]
MKNTKRVYDMTDRELRAHKRKLRRQREQRKKMLSLVFAIALTVICVCFYHSFTAKANDNAPVSYKYYTDVIVKSGESLWTISDRYIDYSQYKSKQAYIDEVCWINSLYDASDIRSGQRLVVPYYSTEFVK